MIVGDRNRRRHDHGHDQNSAENIAVKSFRDAGIGEFVSNGPAPDGYERKSRESDRSSVSGPREGKVGFCGVNHRGKRQYRDPKQEYQVQNQESPVVSNDVAKNAHMRHPIDTDQKEADDVAGHQRTQSADCLQKFFIGLHRLQLWYVEVEDQKGKNDCEDAITQISKPFEVCSLIAQLLRYQHGRILFSNLLATCPNHP